MFSTGCFIKKKKRIEIALREREREGTQRDVNEEMPRRENRDAINDEKWRGGGRESVREREREGEISKSRRKEYVPNIEEMLHIPTVIFW